MAMIQKKYEGVSEEYKVTSNLKNTKEVLLMAAKQKGYTKDSSEETIKDIILWAVKEDWMRMLWVCLFFSPELVV